MATNGWNIGASYGVTGIDIGASQVISGYVTTGDSDIKNATVWFSETGDYENHMAGVNDADAFALVIPTTNDIRWIESLEALLLGTSGDEWKIGSNKMDTKITPTNFSVKQQSSYGSKAIQPIKVNETIIFVDYVGRKLRELTYSDEAQKYVAPDLSALAEHITYSGITSLVHQRNPDSIIWCTLDDGSLLSVTYEREQDVVAWSDHPIDGEVQSVCVTPASTEDEIFLSIQREIQSTDVIYVEKMAPRVFTAIANCFFVDSGLTVTNSPASTTIAGLTHLIGETVTVLGDGVEYTPTAVVDGSGEVEISTAVETAQAGLPFTYKLEPMKPVVSTQMGSSAASITGVHEMGISLLNSAGVKYGTSDDALYDVNLTDAKWVNLSEIDNLFTGTVTVSVNGGFSLEQPLIISSSSPLPCTVRALIPRMEQTGR